MSLLLFFLTCLTYSCGFLLENNIPTATIPSSMTDRHYVMIMDLLMEERRARRQQDQIIQQLKTDLYNTKQEVTQKYLMINQNNKTVEQHYFELANESRHLKNELEQVRDTNAVLKLQFSELKQKYASLENETREIVRNVDHLKQVKAISEMQSLVDIWNETKHLEQEIQKTNNKVIRLTNDANARKQDFLALFNKAKVTEKKLENTSLTLDHKMVSITNGHQMEINSLINKTDYISSELSNRVVISAITSLSKNYGVSQRIIFEHVIFSNNVENATEYISSGIFTCEKNGVYVISVRVVSKPKNAYFYVSLNGLRIADAFSTTIDWFDTASVTFVTPLNRNDKIDIIAGTNMFVWPDGESGLSIFQIL